MMRTGPPDANPRKKRKQHIFYSHCSKEKNAEQKGVLMFKDKSLGGDMRFTHAHTHKETVAITLPGQNK